MASSNQEDGSEPAMKRIKTRSVLSRKLDSMVNRKPSSKPIFCPHCEDGLSAKTYRKHRMLYYNEKDNVWSKVDSCTSSDLSAGNEIMVDIVAR